VLFGNNTASIVDIDGFQIGVGVNHPNTRVLYLLFLSLIFFAITVGVQELYG
jgi:hypothetical protein